MKKCPSTPGQPLSLRRFETPKWDFGHSTRNFRRTTDIHNFRDAFRTRITAHYCTQYNVMLQVNQKDNTTEAKQVDSFHKSIEPVTVHWQDVYLRSAMAALEKLQQEYEFTSSLLKKREAMKNKGIVANMGIIYLENDLARRTVYQNFQYLMKEFEWRRVYDWIHRTASGDLEQSTDSIDKRKSLYIRVKDDDNPFLIKKFFEECYEPIKHEIILPFQTCEEFEHVVQYQKGRAVRGLFELHLVLWKEAGVRKAYRRFEETSARVLQHRKEEVEMRCNEKYFTEKRISILKLSASLKIKQDLRRSILDRVGTNIEVTLNMFLSHILPKTERESAVKNFSAEEKIATIERIFQDLLLVIDTIPERILKPIEERVRKRQAFLQRQAERACDLERQMDNVLKGLKKNLEPPFQKPPPPKPVPRSKIPAMPKKPKPKPPTPTLQEKIFIEAFTETADVADIDLNHPENKQILKGIEKSCMPFYFDHFLSLHGYVPEKNFLTMIEQRDGKEEERFRYQDVLPEVMERFKQWEKQQEYLKKYNIHQTAHLYQK